MEGREIKVIRPIAENDSEYKIRVAAYARVSSDLSEHRDSFFAQMKYYNDYVSQNRNMVLVDIYADEGITGTAANKRDEFQRLIGDCKARKIDRVLVKSVTRFARNSLECIETIRILKSCGVTVFFENDNLDTGNMNSEMLLYIKSAFGQDEAVSASKRMATSARMRMEDGTYKISVAPYGYKLVNGELVVVPEEAEKVKTIYSLYLSGMGMNAIANVMQRNETGNFTWTYARIKYIVSNEKYIGDTLMQKRYSTCSIPFVDKHNRGQVAQYYMENSHEAIISRDDFIAATNIRKSREDKYYKKTLSPTYFLSGKIFCRHCGWAYRRKVINDKVLWVCSKKGSAGTNCSSPSFSDSDVSAAFVETFNKLKINEKILLGDTLSLLQQLRARVNSGNKELTETDKEINSLLEQKNIYDNLYSKGIFDDVLYFEKTDKVRNRLAELKTRKAKLLSEDEGIEELRRLKRIVDNRECLTETDEGLFDCIVKKVYAEADGGLTFNIMGGLELKTYVGGKYGK